MEGAFSHEGHWWCNFASYGADNAGSILARYDDRWREQGRWTYPPEIYRELHGYSFSGRVWREGPLLVTGHDDPVLFHFRLQEGGPLLRLVEKQSAPFTGQGIA